MSHVFVIGDSYGRAKIETDPQIADVLCAVQAPGQTEPRGWALRTETEARGLERSLRSAFSWAVARDGWLKVDVLSVYSVGDKIVRGEPHEALLNAIRRGCEADREVSRLNSRLAARRCGLDRAAIKRARERADAEASAAWEEAVGHGLLTTFGAAAPERGG